MQDAFIVKWKLELADQEIKLLSPQLKKAFAQLSEGNTNFYLYDFDITQYYINTPTFTELINTL